MRSQILLPTIIGILVVGLLFSNLPYVDATQDITIKKIKLDKNWNKMKIESKITGFTVTELSDLTVKLAVVNELNLNEFAFSFINAESLEENDSKNMEITKIKFDKKGKMKIESKITGFTKTSPSKILVVIQIIHSNGETAFSQTYVK